VLFHTPYFNKNEGGLNLLTIDDARPVAAWSSYHAQYCVTELGITAARERAIAWALADVRARGIPERVAAYETQLAQVRAQRRRCSPSATGSRRRGRATRGSRRSRRSRGSAADRRGDGGAAAWSAAPPRRSGHSISPMAWKPLST
jgi:hypothetical protein